MTSSHNHLGDNNPLFDDLFTPLNSELDGESVDIGITNNNGSYSDLLNPESEELSSIAEGMEGNQQDDYDYGSSLFNNRPRSFSSNYNNYGGGSYTGNDNDFSVNQDATNSQADGFGDEVFAQGTGLTGEYFDRADLTKSILTRTDTNIDFDWKKGSPDSAIKKNTFSVRWTGQIEATRNETYTFYTQADDGVRLWVNNELIIDDWKQHGVQERSGRIDLEAGEFYDIKLEYFEKKGSAAVSLLWSSPTQNKEVIPTSFLYPEDYVPPIVPTDLAITAPGENDEQVTATLSLVSKGGAYNNEAGLFIVDDETGRISNLNPGDDGYAAAALAPERRLLVLGSGENQIQTNISGGSYIGSYLIQNNTTEAFLVHNPQNNLHGNPVAFFNFTSTNPDNFDHLESSSAGENSVNLAWEDLRGGGDKDFDDLIVKVDFAIASEPIIPISPSNLDFSIVAEGEVRVNGSSDFDGDPTYYSDDALIYAGKGFTFNGNLELPVVRDAAGNPITDSDNKEVLLDNAVAVSSDYLYSNVNGNNTNRYSGLIPPTVVDTQTVIVPDYQSVLDETLATTIATGTNEINFNIQQNWINNKHEWSQKFPVPGTADNPIVVRVTGGGLNIPSNVDLSNYVIIVEHGSINFNGSGHDLDNVVLVAQNGNINLSQVQAQNSSIFASSTINMNSQARFSGQSLIANGQGNINFDGATVTSEESDFLTVISPGNITFNGSSDTRGKFLTAQNFTFNGHSTLYGSIGAKKDITFNGNGTVIGVAPPNVNPNSEVTIDNVTIVEGDVGTKIAVFNVTLSNPSDTSVTVDYGTEDNTAIAGQDYSATSGTVTFEPGETTQTIEVPIIGDSLDESDKEFLVNLSNPSNANIVDAQGTGAIEDNDDAPVLSISRELVTEGDTGIKQAEFTVMLSNPSGKEISVDFNTLEGTAIEGSDYNAITGTLIFAPGEISKTITVDVLGDNIDEVDEAFSIQLDNPKNVTLANNLATVTIIDNDLPPEVTIGNLEVAEGNEGTSNATITISLDRASSLPISVDYATADGLPSNGGTATVGSDYQAINGTVEFAPGETSKTIEVAIAGDVIDEFDETLAINLTNASNATIAKTTGTVTILNDDALANISVGDVVLVEGNDGSSNATFTVSLTTASSKPITIDFTTVDGTAIAGEDFVGVNGTLEFAPGETNKTIEVAVLGDKIDEIDEAFTIHLANPSNADILNNNGTGIITNDDLPPTITVQDLTLVEGDSGSREATFTLALDATSDKEITIDYSTVDGTAIAGDDYEAIAGTLTFAPGEISKIVSVLVNSDTLDELDEAFFLQLDNAVNSVIDRDQVTVTITNDDNPPSVTVNDITLTEGSNSAVFTITLDNPSGKEITIDYSTVDGTAIAGEDYTTVTGTITFAPGETSQIIEVALLGDSIDEFNESFSLNLDGGSNVIITNSQATANLDDNDDAPSIAVGDVTLVEGDNGTSNASFTITLDNPSGKEITVDYSTVDGTAIAGEDYEEIAGIVTFAPGETSKTIDVAVNGDTINEIDEAFNIQLANPSNSTLTDDSATINIVDNDLLPELRVNNITVDEDSNSAIVTVTLDNPSSKEISIDYSTVDGSAIAGEDYTAISGTLSFAPGETSKTIEVDLLGDSIDEIDEAFAINLSNVSNVIVPNPETVVTLVDNDLLPEISIDDLIVTEGDSGSTTANFTVTLNSPSSKEIAVDYSTLDGTALAETDYVTTSGTLTFAPGETSKTIAVDVTGDIIDEIDEAFALSLNNASNAVVVQSPGTATIIDNDLPPEISINEVIVTETDEGTTNAVFTVTLGNPSSQSVTVDYSTKDGTAIAGTDYVATNGTLTFAPGETSKTVSVSVIGDSLDELDKEFSLDLDNSSNASIADGSGQGTIIDNDLPPEVIVESVTVIEGDIGTKEAQFVVSLNAPSELPVTVDYATADNTAIAGEDYLAKSGTITFIPGETSKTISVSVIGDSLDELTEAFNLNLSNITNATLDSFTAMGTIADDDLPPEISIDSVTVTEGDTDLVNSIFTISLNSPSNLPITVEYSTSDNTAIVVEDYQDINGTLTFNPGETSKTITISVVGDSINEDNESFTINLANPTNAIIVQDQGTGTIVDNDEPEIVYEIILNEGNNFQTTETKTITIPDAPSRLSFTYDLDFDLASIGSIKDSFEVALVDASGNSLVHTIATGKDSFFNQTEGAVSGLGVSTTESQQTVTLDLAGIKAGTEASLIFRLINNDGDSNTSVKIGEINLETIADAANYNAIADGQIKSDRELDFTKLEDVSNSLQPVYGTTSFNNEEQILNVDVSIANQGTYQVRDSLIVVVENLSNPNVTIQAYDGLTPDGLPYFDLSRLMNEGDILNPAEATGSRTISFFNPQGVQFTYDLVLLGELNQAPYFMGEPDTEALIGKTYSYQPMVTDNDGDDLSYSLEIAPLGMTVDATTGEVTWTPEAGNIGSHWITVAVTDGKQTSTQSYTLEVLNSIPNRPPIFNSIPVVDANVNTNYDYQVKAVDADGEELSYALAQAPLGMTIDETTGLIEWIPTAQQLGRQAVTLEVIDTAGGKVQQDFEILVQAEAGNNAPVITSEPLVVENIDLFSGVSQPKAFETNISSIANGTTASSIAGQVFSDVTRDGNRSYIESKFLVDNSELDTYYEVGEQVYTEDFEGALGSEWSVDDGNISSNLSRYLGKYDYPYDPEGKGFVQTLSLETEVGQTYLLEYDQYTFNTFGALEGPIYTYVDINGERAVEWENSRIPKYEQDLGTAYANLNIASRDLPFIFTATSETTEIDFGSYSSVDQVFPFVTFFGRTRFWGMDNVEISEIADVPGFESVESGVDNLQVELVDSITNEVVAIRETQTQDLNGDGKINPATEQGLFEFEGLETGDYLVRTVLPPQWLSTGSSSGIEVNLAAGEDVSGLEFGAFKQYFYDVEAADTDGDALTYSLLEAPEGAVIDETTGEVTWNPPANGEYEFTVAVADDRGGLSTQNFFLTNFEKQDTIPDSPVGQIFPLDINIDASISELVTETVSITLPNNTFTEEVDIFFLIDDSNSFTFSSPLYTDVSSNSPKGVAIDGFNQLITEIQTNSPELNFGFGVGLFEDYIDFVRYLPFSQFSGDRPFILNQPIITPGSPEFETIIASALGRGAGGAGAGETYIEALYQTATGVGFDNNNDGDTLDAGDVPSFNDFVGNQSQNSLISTGKLGGGGFREGALPIIIVATDTGSVYQPDGLTEITGIDGTVLPASQFQDAGRAATPQGRGATIQGTVDALNSLGALVIGLGTDGNDSAAPRQTLESLSLLTGGVNTSNTTIDSGIDGDDIAPGDPLYFTLPSNTLGYEYENGGFATGISQALDSIVASAIDIDIKSDNPDIQINNLTGVVSNVNPGNTATFDVQFTGEGLQQDFNLLFVKAKTELVLGSVPVSIDSDANFNLGEFNFAPTIISTPDETAVANTDYQYSVKAIDADGDIAAYRLDAAPQGMTIDPTTGVIDWTPTTEQLGTSTVRVVALDDLGSETSQVFSLEVAATAPNNAPFITSTPRDSVQLSSSYFYQVNVRDLDDDALTYNLLSSPLGMSISESGRINWTPTSNQFGSNEVVVEVTDSRGDSIQQSFTVDVTSTRTNSAPVIVSSPELDATVSWSYEYVVTARDADNDVVLYDLESAPQGMSIDAETGILRWIPTQAQVGKHEVTVRALDLAGDVTTQSFELLVRGTNLAPSITSSPTTLTGINTDYSYSIDAVDVEGDSLTYRLLQSPSGMTIDAETGVIDWTPDTSGNVEIIAEVRDSKGATATQTYNLVVQDTTINPINQIPSITSSPKLEADSKEPYSYQIVANDPDGDVLTYQLIDAPAGMTVDAVTGLVSWNNPQVGAHQVVVSTADSAGGSSQSFTLNIKDNNAPVINSVPNTSALSNQAYSYDVVARDADGDQLSYSLDETSLAKGITIDALGRLRWNSDSNNVGTHELEITVTDTRGASTLQAFTLEVVADTQAPEVNLFPVDNVYLLGEQYQAPLGELVTFQLVAEDNIGVETKQLFVNDVPVAIGLDGRGIIPAGELGTVEIRAIAIDGAGNQSQTTTTLEIVDFRDEDAPTVELDLSHIPNNTITSTADLIGTVNDSNLDYYVLEYAVAGTDNFVEIARGSNNINDGAIATFDPSVLANEAYTVRLTGFDDNGNFASSSETIYVEGELKLGNFQLSFTDLAIPVAGIPISVTRTYDTLTANDEDDFGFGWRLEFRDTNLRTSVGTDDTFAQFDLVTKGFQAGDKVYLTLPGGQRETFTFAPELDRLGGFLVDPITGSGGLYHPRFISESDSNNVLTVDDVLITLSESGQYAGLAGLLYNPIEPYFGGQYTLTTGEGIVYDIDAETGDLLSATDTNGNKLNFSDAGINSDSGVEVKFGRDAAGRITSVIDPDGNVIEYQYDEAGDLISVTDREENTTSYGYSEERSHYLDEIIDPLGRSGVKTEYDENGRLSRVIDVNGEAVELNYDPDNSVQTTKDVFGNETTYVYDVQGNVLTEIDPIGKVTERTYDKDGNVLTETVITEDSGSEGNTTTYNYDDRGNKLSEADALGNTTRYTYGKQDRLLSETDALGNTTTYNYDDNGNLLATKDAAGNITKYSYDSQGNLISFEDADRNSSSFTYNISGNVTKVVDAAGNTTTYTYDFQGNQTSETRTVTTPDGVEEIVTRYEYDTENNLLSTIDSENNNTRYEYDKVGNQTAVIDALGRRTEYHYDDKGQLIETIYPDNTPETLEDNPRNISVYDRGSNQRATIDAVGRVTYYNYDAVGQLVETIYPDATDTLTQFVSFIDPTKTITTVDWSNVIYPDSSPIYLGDNPRIGTEYYQDGQVKANINERGYRTEYIYDANNQLIEVIYPELANNPGINSSTTYSYDVVGRKISETNALGRTTEYVYDELGRIVETKFVDGTSTTSTYDGLGRRVASTDQERKLTYYEYDSFDRITKVIQFLNQDSTNLLEIRTEYGYDELGRLIWQEDTNDRRTLYEYDKASRRTVVELPGGQSSSTSYDAVGNIVSYTDFDLDTITYVYDEQNRLIEKQFPNDSLVNYTYAIDGLRESITDSRGATIYTYDERDRLTSHTEPNGSTIEYSYDVAGNRTSVTTPSETVNYTFDAWNRLQTVIDSDANTTVYNYDGVSNLIQTNLPSGVVETRSYDELNRLTSLENKSGEDIISSYKYTLDDVGHRLKVEEHEGRVVEYKYDDLYRLTEEAITDSNDAVNDGRTINYTYDNVGNRLTKVDSSEGTSTYVYNENDWLLESTTDGIVTNYQYDDNGNLVTQTVNGETTAYIWDDQNRLIEAQTADGDVVIYEYNDENIRVSTTVNGAKTTYLVDSNLPYAQVLEEYQDENIKAKYVHGLDLISIEQDGATSIYLVDGLGSTRTLTDIDGDVVATYDYEAFGDLIDSTGAVENNYLFTGEQFDGELGQYYLRDRYYDQGVGRFTRKDVFEGHLGNPVTLHKYLYAHNNPTNLVDPSGLTPLSDFLRFVKSLEILPNWRSGLPYVFGQIAHRAIQRDIQDQFLEARKEEYVQGGGFIDVFIPKTDIYEIKPLGGVEDPHIQLNRYIQAGSLQQRVFTKGSHPFFNEIENPPPLVGITIHYFLEESGVIRYHPEVNQTGINTVLGLAGIGAAYKASGLISRIVFTPALAFGF